MTLFHHTLDSTSLSVGVHSTLGECGSISHNWQVGEYIPQLASVGVYSSLGKSDFILHTWRVWAGTLHLASVRAWIPLFASAGIYSKLVEGACKL